MSQSGMPGTYVAQYGFATDTLELASDGHFTQTVKVTATGKVVTASGAWTLDPRAGYITLSGGFLIITDSHGQFNPGFEHPKLKGNAVFPVRRWPGGLHIGDDPGVPYVEQPKAKSTP